MKGIAWSEDRGPPGAGNTRPAVALAVAAAGASAFTSPTRLTSTGAIAAPHGATVGMDAKAPARSAECSIAVVLAACSVW